MLYSIPCIHTPQFIYPFFPFSFSLFPLFSCHSFQSVSSFPSIFSPVPPPWVSVSHCCVCCICLHQCTYTNPSSSILPGAWMPPPGLPSLTHFLELWLQAGAPRPRSVKLICYRGSLGGRDCGCHHRIFCPHTSDCHPSNPGGKASPLTPS